MFGWRRKRDGFEWRSYVRTTILVKRKKRRERLEEAKQAAWAGLAEAGRAGHAAGQSGLEVAQRGIGAAWRRAQATGAGLGARLAAGAHKGANRLGHGARAAGRAAQAGSLWAGSGLLHFCQAIGSRLAAATVLAVDRLAAGLEGIGRAMSPRVALPLVIAGSAAAIGAASRLAQVGFDGITLSASLIATGLLGLAALPVLSGRATLSRPFTTIRYDSQREGDGSNNPATAGLPGAARKLAAIILAGAVIGVGSLALTSFEVPSVSLSLTEVTAPTETIQGLAKALTGDVMLIGGERIVLKGIDAPEPRQTCQDGRGRSWRCGRAALNALRRITGFENVVCDVSGEDPAGRKISDCRIGETNIAAELVKEGYVFTESGLFPPYREEEAAAKAAGRGVWRGKAQRPESYRAEIWESATLNAPKGCPIKGKERALRREKIYFLPWSTGYDQYSVSTKRGDRWFCTESEALDAGWSPFES
jgi:endonuclease YncB( thermonuclease family)